MEPRKVFRMSGMVVGGLMVGFLATSLNGSPVAWMKTTLLESLGVSPSMVQAGPLENREPGIASLQVAQGVRPAAKKERPEEAQLKKMPPPVLPGQMRRPSKAGLLDKCMKNPRCRAKFQAAKKRGPNKPRPAAREESPEDKELKKLLKPVNPKARRLRPRSDLMLPEDTHTLLSWLNPFQVDPVYAQSAVFSIHLTPGGPWVGQSYMVLYGATAHPNNEFSLIASGPQNTRNSQNKSYAYYKLIVPTTGTYLLNVQAGRGKAVLRHQPDGPIIARWDFMAPPYRPVHDYITAEYLAQGSHGFYFGPIGRTDIQIWSVSLESYP